MTQEKNHNTNHYDVIVIGAGAAGLMTAQVAGKRQRRVLVLEASDKIAEKIRISGGGRCNFTNRDVSPQNYLSNNPHFCKSALSQFSQHDFIHMVEKHGINYHEKALGQLFCDVSSQKIIDMLLAECERGDVTILTEERVKTVKYNIEIPAKAGIHMDPVSSTGFRVGTDNAKYTCSKLVIATGGLSIPKIGANDFGYRMAKQFGLNVIEQRAGLVPLTFDQDFLKKVIQISGVSIDANVSCGDMSFREGLLFTHRGLSGPSILQISSYWQEGMPISINLIPDIDDAMEWLKYERKNNPRHVTQKVLSTVLPRRLADVLIDIVGIKGTMADLSNRRLQELADFLTNWKVYPNGTEGYRTAEVTLGGVDTNGLSSKTMECRNVPNLYFVGEVMDVTGHLGGFNFQWAWSSGYACGMSV